MAGDCRISGARTTSSSAAIFAARRNDRNERPSVGPEAAFLPAWCATSANAFTFRAGLWATRDEVAEYRDKNKIAYPVVLDESGALFRAFDVMSVPTVVVLDGDARIRRRVEDSTTDLRAAVAASR
jgi:hypothetical protein